MDKKTLLQLIKQDPFFDLASVLGQMNATLRSEMLAYFYKQCQALQRRYEKKTRINVKLREDYRRLSKRNLHTNYVNEGLEYSLSEANKVLKSKLNEQKLLKRVKYLERQLNLAVSTLEHETLARYQLLSYSYFAMKAPLHGQLLETIHAN